MSRKLVIGLLLAVFAVGCQSASSPTQLPEGWMAADGRWWQSGVDTSQAFREMETFQMMGVPFEEVTFSVDQPLLQQPVRMKRRLINRLKRAFAPMYRHRPEVVDSLFQRFVVPMIQNASAPAPANVDEQFETYKQRAYQELRRHFTEPRARLELGTDVPIIYPDSLRRQGVGGIVRMQVYLNEAGDPLAVRTLEGVHPTLNQIARRAATQMRWHPAYLEETPIRSWVRYSIRFTP